MLDLEEHPHKRYNLLTREWILISPHRARRPWQGQIEDLPVEANQKYDPDCYLCPGNARAGGMTNPEYKDTFVFDNDFPALLTGSPGLSSEESSLLIASSERGICRVVCFSPQHDLTLARMDLTAIERVVETWISQYCDLGSVDWVNFVQIFENRGAMMGCSNPHPHCQIWANETLPNEPSKEHSSQSDFDLSTGLCLLCSYLEIELRRRERIVVETESFVALVPFWAVWPFETILISRRHITGIDQLSSTEKESLAQILKKLTTRYDNLFHTSFPYSMGFHQRPTDGAEHSCWHLHAHFYPPLLRSATVRKFMVGYEMLGSPQRDITAEAAAKRLSELPDTHYLEGQ